MAIVIEYTINIQKFIALYSDTACTVLPSHRNPDKNKHQFIVIINVIIISIRWFLEERHDIFQLGLKINMCLELTSYFLKLIMKSICNLKTNGWLVQQLNNILSCKTATELPH